MAGLNGAGRIELLTFEMYIHNIDPNDVGKNTHQGHVTIIASPHSNFGARCNITISRANEGPEHNNAVRPWKWHRSRLATWRLRGTVTADCGRP